ncbi:hypothetical protein SDC9_193297 [bioreactor metagenome]|uniref:Uncharacterized protein n=1 Tax=bioreactor metagenome TaxID=1076179 RepID=A0A645I335_9ZZZZ
MGIIGIQGLGINEVLNGPDIMVDEELLSLFRPRKSANPIVDGDDVGVKTSDEIIQRLQRRYSSAGGNLDVHPEAADVSIRMILRIGVHRQVTFV